jgi:hypothetical protein
MIDVPIKPEEYFRLRDGRVLADLKELFYALKAMDDSVFSHHLTQDRNDFGNWILHVFKEREMAEEVFDSRSKEDIVSALGKRIFPKLDQLEITDQRKSQSEAPKRFDFRQHMAEKFGTVKDASESNVEDDTHDVNDDNEYSTSQSKEPDLAQIVQEIKKKRGRKPKSMQAAAVSSPAQPLPIPELQSRSSEYPKPSASPDIITLQKAAELVKAYPFERTTAKEMKEQADSVQKTQNEILEKEKETLAKVDEMLLKERELELREQKILEIEERLEKELMEIASRKDPKFFSKEFVHGLLIGLLTALIIGLVYVKFWM